VPGRSVRAMELMGRQSQSTLRIVCIDAEGWRELFLTRRELAAQVNRQQADKGDNATVAALTVRDLRKMDPNSLTMEPMLSVRQGCILLCLLEGLRAVACRTELYLILPKEPDSPDRPARPSFSRAVHNFEATVPKLQSKLALLLKASHQRAALPFELSAVEALLHTATEELDARIAVLHKDTDVQLRHIQGKIGTLHISPEGHSHIRGMKTKVEALLLEAQATEKVLSGVSDDAALGQICTVSSGATSYEEEVDEVIDATLHEFNAAINALQVLKYNIENTEKALDMHLDFSRNRLLKVEVAATFIAAAMSTGSLIGSLFGMNLQTPIFDEQGWVFNLVVIVVFVIVAGSLSILYGYLYVTRSCVRGNLATLAACCGCGRSARSQADESPPNREELLTFKSPMLVRPGGGSTPLAEQGGGLSDSESQLTSAIGFLSRKSLSVPSERYSR